MLAFLETGLKLDASGLAIGTGANNTISVGLTIDQRSANLPSFTASVPANLDATIPYTLVVTKINAQLCKLDIIFDKPVANVHFGETRTLTINGGGGNTYSLPLEVNYANSFNTTDWTNSSEVLSIDDIDIRGPLTSVSMNNRLRALLHSSLTAFNQIKNYIQYYSFKEKYLHDIIDFAIMGGSSLEPSVSTISYNSDGNVTQIITDYQAGANSRSITRLKISYTYANYTLNRLMGSDANTPLTTETISLLNTIKIEALDNSNNSVYTLGTITLNRAVNVSSIPYLKDYNVALLPSDPDNKLSDFKYYRTNTVTGWTVVA